MKTLSYSFIILWSYLKGRRTWEMGRRNSFFYILGVAVWELPQNVLGLLLLMLCSSRVVRFTVIKSRLVLMWDSKYSVSLGFVAFASVYGDMMTVYHEWGHTRQSKLLGPLYLLVIGIRSFIHSSMWGNVWYRRAYDYDYDNLSIEGMATKYGVEYLAKRTLQWKMLRSISVY